jgi:hypothetical protein
VDREFKREVRTGVALQVSIPGYASRFGTLTASTYLPSTVYTGIVLDDLVESVWFSGAFSFFLEETDTLLGKLAVYEQLANKLLGGRLDASVVWELTPWSWLIDWFVDVSSFVGRVNRLASDNLVLRYGYVMHSQHIEQSYMLPDIYDRSGRRIPSPHMTYHGHVMRRVRSTPYGFGLSDGDLTPRRWAILAALGMTKAPGVLRSP